MSSNNNPQSIQSSSASTSSNMVPFISNVAVSAKALTPVSKRKRPDYSQMMQDRTFIYLIQPFKCYSCKEPISKLLPQNKLTEITQEYHFKNSNCHNCGNFVLLKQDLDNLRGNTAQIVS